MNLDFSGYPPTKKGARTLVDALTPRIVSLWRSERKNRGTDDLVAIVDVATNHVRVDSRSVIYSQLKRRDPTLTLLNHVFQQPPTMNGTIKIWSLVGFPKGQIYTLPITLCYS